MGTSTSSWLDRFRHNHKAELALAELANMPRVSGVLVKVAGSIHVVVGTAAAWGSAAAAFKGGRRPANRHKAKVNFLVVVGVMVMGRARLGGASFTDVTSTAGGVGGASDGRGIAVADYDGDGNLDLYSPNNGANILYQNDGDGTFTDVTSTAGVGDTGTGAGAAWADYDGDGDMDLYVTNGAANDGANVRLYRNDGGGTFTDVASSAGVGDTSRGQGVVWTDYDGDGDLDVYITKCG